MSPERRKLGDVGKAGPFPINATGRVSAPPPPQPQGPLGPASPPRRDAMGVHRSALTMNAERPRALPREDRNVASVGESRRVPCRVGRGGTPGEIGDPIFLGALPGPPVFPQPRARGSDHGEGAGAGPGAGQGLGVAGSGGPESPHVAQPLRPSLPASRAPPTATRERGAGPGPGTPRGRSRRPRAREEHLAAGARGTHPALGAPGRSFASPPPAHRAPLTWGGAGAASAATPPGTHSAPSPSACPLARSPAHAPRPAAAAAASTARTGSDSAKNNKSVHPPARPLL